MLVVKIELWPHGSEAMKTVIGEARIANDGTGTAVLGNYDVQLAHSGRYASRPGVWKRGRVLGHARELSPYHLVLRALQVALTARAPTVRTRDLFAAGARDEGGDGA